MNNRINNSMDRRQVLALFAGLAMAGRGDIADASAPDSNALEWRTRCIYRRGKKVCWVVH